MVVLPFLTLWRRGLSLGWGRRLPDSLLLHLLGPLHFGLTLLLHLLLTLHFSLTSLLLLQVLLAASLLLLLCLASPGLLLLPFHVQSLLLAHSHFLLRPLLVLPQPLFLMSP